MARESDLRRVGEIERAARDQQHARPVSLEGVPEQLEQIARSLELGVRGGVLVEQAERVWLDFIAMQGELKEVKREAESKSNEVTVSTLASFRMSDHRLRQIQAVEASLDVLKQLRGVHEPFDLLAATVTGESRPERLTELSVRLKGAAALLREAGIQAPGAIPRPFLRVTGEDMPCAIELGDTEGVTATVDPGSVSWAVVAVLAAHPLGNTVGVDLLANGVDLLMVRYHQQVVERSEGEATGGVWTGDERHEGSQFHSRKPRVTAPYSGQEPSSIIDKLSAVLRNGLKGDAKVWTQKWIHWDRKTESVTVEWRAKKPRVRGSRT